MEIVKFTITKYLATLHLTYVRAIIYNPTFHKKKT